MKKFFLEAGPVLRALTRNRAGAVLIALQCAVTLAIVTNSIFIIQDRVQKMLRPSGVDAENVFSLRVLPFKQNYDMKNDIARDMRELRALPGVLDASVVGSLPLSGGGSSTGLRTQADGAPETRVPMAYYETDEHGLNSLGLKLISGRDFNADEVTTWAPNSERSGGSVILSKALADKLFPDGQAVGKPLYYSNGDALQVVGVVERLQTPWIFWGELEDSMLIAQYTLSPIFVRYVVRSEPGQLESVISEVEKKLAQLDPNRVIRDTERQTEVESKAYASYRAMAVILGAVIVLIVAVTSLGIVGLASFNVNARRKQIGTRRALGAQKGDIIRYFLVESWLITTAGAAIGAGLSFALSYWMANTFDLPPLDWRYVPVGVLFLWLLGQIAVLAPARRAAELPPALATRSA